jgi:hypothetical protein
MEWVSLWFSWMYVVVIVSILSKVLTYSAFSVCWNETWDVARRCRIDSLRHRRQPGTDIADSRCSSCTDSIEGTFCS